MANKKVKPVMNTGVNKDLVNRRAEGTGERFN